MQLQKSGYLMDVLSRNLGALERDYELEKSFDPLLPDFTVWAMGKDILAYSELRGIIDSSMIIKDEIELLGQAQAMITDISEDVTAVAMRAGGLLFNQASVIVAATRRRIIH